MLLIIILRKKNDFSHTELNQVQFHLYDVTHFFHSMNIYKSVIDNYFKKRKYVIVIEQGAIPFTRCYLMLFFFLHMYIVNNCNLLLTIISRIRK